MQVTEDGVTVTVATGAPIEVELPPGPGAGYQWQLEVLPDGVQQVGSDFSPALADDGTQIFHLRTTRSGRFELRFLLRRGWESPLQTRVIDIESR